MKEPFAEKVKRKWQEFQIKIAKAIIKKAVKRLDDLEYKSFMTFSWGVDEVTDYHVIAERSYPDHHVFGTKVTWYNA